MHFVNEKFCIWIKVSLKFFLKVPIDNNSIGLDNGLALKRRQAIIWTNADPIHWCIYAALGEMSLRQSTWLSFTDLFVLASDNDDQGWD